MEVYEVHPYIHLPSFIKANGWIGHFCMVPDRISSINRNLDCISLKLCNLNECTSIFIYSHLSQWILMIFTSSVPYHQISIKSCEPPLRKVFKGTHAHIYVYNFAYNFRKSMNPRKPIHWV